MTPVLKHNISIAYYASLRSASYLIVYPQSSGSDENGR
jgi:hypothetical protein